MNRYVIRVNGPLAAIVIAAMLIVAGGWVALFWAGKIPLSSLSGLATHVVAFAVGTGVPLFTWFQKKGISFDTGSSSPPRSPPPPPPSP